MREPGGRHVLPMLCLCAVVMMAGCGSGSSGSEDEATVQVQLTAGPEELQAYEELAQAFEERHPHIDVQLIAMSNKDDHIAKLNAALSGGSPPDVVLLNYREYGQFAARDALAPVGPLLKRAEYSLDDFQETVLDAFTHDGELQCLPQNVSSAVVYYNPRLFEEAGVAEPGRQWSWEQLRTSARALTAGDVHGLGLEPQLIRLAPFVWSNGGRLVDDEDDPTRFVLHEPQAREALDFVIGLVRRDRVVPSAKDLVAADLETRFVSGRLAMLISSRRLTPVLLKAHNEFGFDFDVAPMPVADTPATILHSDAYCLARPATPDSPAMRFLTFALSQRGQSITASSGRTVPSRLSVARSEDFLNPHAPPARDAVFLDAVAHARTTPVIATWPQVEQTADTVVERMFYERGYDIDDGIADLRRQTDRMFAAAANADGSGS